MKNTKIKDFVLSIFIIAIIAIGGGAIFSLFVSYTDYTKGNHEFINSTIDTEKFFLAWKVITAIIALLFTSFFIILKKQENKNLKL